MFSCTFWRTFRLVGLCVSLSLLGVLCCVRVPVLCAEIVSLRGLLFELGREERKTCFFCIYLLSLYIGWICLAISIKPKSRSLGVLFRVEVLN